MVLPSNRELLLRRLVECLGRDRTRHQVAGVTRVGLVQMTRKRIGTGLLEAFSTECPVCHGRGVKFHGRARWRRSGRLTAALASLARQSPGVRVLGERPSLGRSRLSTRVMPLRRTATPTGKQPVLGGAAEADRRAPSRSKDRRCPKRLPLEPEAATAG